MIRRSRLTSQLWYSLLRARENQAMTGIVKHRVSVAVKLMDQKNGFIFIKRTIFLLMFIHLLIHILHT